MRADMESGLTTSQAITRAYLDRIKVYDQGQFGFNAYEIVAARRDGAGAGRRRGARGGQALAACSASRSRSRTSTTPTTWRPPTAAYLRGLPPEQGRLPGRQAARGGRGDHRQGGAGGVRDQRQLLQRPVGPGLERVQPVEVGDRVDRRLGHARSRPASRRARWARRPATRSTRPRLGRVAGHAARHGRPGERQRDHAAVLADRLRRRDDPLGRATSPTCSTSSPAPTPPIRRPRRPTPSGPRTGARRSTRTRCAASGSATSRRSGTTRSAPPAPPTRRRRR